MNIEKKKNKKTNKQKGGLSPLATIFRVSQKRNNPTSIRNIANNLWSEPSRLDFINIIKELLLSPEYQRNVPVFYGNQSDRNKSSGYNEYICKIVGVFSSRKRIFIINPFAEFVYRILLFCIAEGYNNQIIRLQNLLKKLLKLDNFIGFPEIKYLEYRMRFCIVKNKDGVESVITSQNSNISRCRYGYGCSLMMSAEIRKENLPSEKDISELHDILYIDNKLWIFYHLSKNKTEYNKILNKNYKKNKLSKEYYFRNIWSLFIYLDELQNLFIQSENNNDYIEKKKYYRKAIEELFNKIVEGDKSFFTLKQHIELLISQQLSKETLQYSILLKIVDFVITQLKTNNNDFGFFLQMFEKLKKKYELIENTYFKGILNLLLLLHNLIQVRIKNNSLRPSYISELLDKIQILNSDIPELQKIFMIVKYNLVREDIKINISNVSTQLLKMIVKILKNNTITYKNFLSFLEKNLVHKQQILGILRNY